MSKFSLPNDYTPYIDKYFLRAKEVLIKDNLNPIVRYQIFIRNGGILAGINEALAIIQTYTKDVQVWALKEGSEISPCETIMIIEAPIQNIIDLETMILGVISADTTIKTDGIKVNTELVEEHMISLSSIAKDKPIAYFGARHWRWDEDFIISNACYRGGATSCSTDRGAGAFGQKGIGTIPHALEAIYHWKYELNRAVLEATIAFDRYIDKSVPRIALVDYANREVTDSLWIAGELGTRLYGVRIDTCGENYMEATNTEKGVSIEGVKQVRMALNGIGREDVKIVLSSGFGNPKKLHSFIQAEKDLNMKLFDSLGIGGVYYSRMATMDIVQIEGQEIHKVGRPARPNSKLERII
jgi:nicotinate phosphoribosyltransferase